MKRTVEISLEKAKEWYNSGNTSLKEVALQAFEESELMGKPWESIKTYEDACRVLNIDPYNVKYLWDAQAQSMYKLQIVRKALNGANWEPKLNEGIIYYPWMRYCTGDVYNRNWTPVAKFRDKKDNKVYTLIGGDWSYSSGGIGNFGEKYGYVAATRVLLSCKSIDIAQYFGITFGKLIFDAIYSQYNNYEWLS